MRTLLAIVTLNLSLQIVPFAKAQSSSKDDQNTKPETATAGSPAASSLPPGALARFSASKGQWIKPIGFAADGQTVVLWTGSGILLGNLKTFEVKQFLSATAMGLDQAGIQNAALSPDGNTLVVNGGEVRKGNAFSYWDLRKGVQIKSIYHELADAMGGFLGLSPDQKYLVWSFKTTVLVRANTKNAEIQKTVAMRTVNDVSFSPDGKLLAIACGGGGERGGWKDHVIEIRQLSNMKQVGMLAAKHRGGDCISFSPDGTTLAAGGGGNIDFWDPKDERIIRRLPQPTGVLQWLPDGGGLVVSFAEKNTMVAQLIEQPTGKHICEFGPLNARQSCINSEGSLIAIGSGKEVFVWDLQAPPGYRVRKNAQGVTNDELQQLWEDLDKNAPATGYLAMLQLVQAEKTAVRFLARFLSPAAVPKLQHLEQLIALLDAPGFDQREQAMKELAAMGRMAEESLRKAIGQNPTIETERRLKALLLRFAEDKLLPEELRQMRAVRVLHRIGSRDAVELLQMLANGGPWSRQTQAAQAALKAIAIRKSRTTEDTTGIQNHRSQP